MSEGEFVALYDRGVEVRMPASVAPRLRVHRRRGWFVDACTGSAYDLTGRCASQVCNGALLDRFAVQIQDGNVIVELDQVLRDPAASQPAG